MELPGIYTIMPHDEDLIISLSKMAGVAYGEERWMMALMEGLPPESQSNDRKRYLAEAFVLNELIVSTPRQCGYCLKDGSALAQAYLNSELEGLSWQDLEDAALKDIIESVLSEDEAECLLKRYEELKDVSNFHWMESEKADDFIHFVFLAVDPKHRGSGAFRRLVQPFLDYADKQAIPCYLETYSEALVGLYEHFGFKTLYRFESPHTTLVERAMVREPHA